PAHAGTIGRDARLLGKARRPAGRGLAASGIGARASAGGGRGARQPGARPRQALATPDHAPQRHRHPSLRLLREARPVMKIERGFLLSLYVNLALAVACLACATASSYPVAAWVGAGPFAALFVLAFFFEGRWSLNTFWSNVVVLVLAAA